MAAQDVIVVGSGIVGCSVAYHLALLGRTDVVVVDARTPDELPGSTGLAPGLVGQLSGGAELPRLAMESVSLYTTLADRSGEPMFWSVGCLEVATSERRLTAFHDDIRHGRELGLSAMMVDPDEAASMAPGLVAADTALGALFVPADGAADPVRITAALAAAAQEMGVRFLWSSPVRRLELAQGRIAGVRLDSGWLRASTVVLAAGIWGPELAASAGVDLALVPVEHPYAYTDPRPELIDKPITMPIVRYPDHAIYGRQHGRRYGFGSYAHDPAPVSGTALGTTALRPFRDDLFAPALDEAVRCLPALRDARVQRQINGVFALTPDELPLVGESREVPGLWFAEASWVTHAGGVGKLLANLMMDTGDYLVDPGRLHPDRFAAWSAEGIRSAALRHYRGIYDAH